MIDLKALILLIGVHAHVSSSKCVQKPKDVPTLSTWHSGALLVDNRAMPDETWRVLLSSLPSSGIAACCGCNKRLHKELIGAVRLKGCISTLKRLLRQHGALTEEGSIDEGAFCDRDERTCFWHCAMEALPMCLSELNYFRTNAAILLYFVKMKR